MTVSSTNNVTIVNGDGSAANFTFNFKIFAASDLKVIVRSSAGIETEQTLNSEYIIEDSSVNNDSGGVVKFKHNTGNSSDPNYSTTDFRPPNQSKVVMRQNIAVTQTLDLVNNDPFNAETLEQSLDKIVLQIQNVQESADRAIKFSRSNLLDNNGATISVTYPEVEEDTTARANKVLSFDSTGTPIATQEIGTYRGAWVSGTAYQERDIVKDTSSSDHFIVTTAHTSSGSLPLITNPNVSYYSAITDFSGNISVTSVTASNYLSGKPGTENFTAGTNAGSSLNAYGHNNIFIGHDAGKDNTQGDENVVIGNLAFSSSVDSAKTVAIGFEALKNHNSSANSHNVVVGTEAAKAATNANSLTAIGSLAAISVENSDKTTAVGMAVLNKEKYTAGATAVGAYALYKGQLSTSTGQAVGWYNNNTAIGIYAGYGFGETDFYGNYTGSQGINNTFLGGESGYSYKNGNGNVYAGYRSGLKARNGDYNVAIGFEAMRSPDFSNPESFNENSQGKNTAVGYRAYFNADATGDTFNTMVGAQSGYNLAASTYNTLIGSNAGFEITSGSKNVILGSYEGDQAPYDIRTSDNNIVLSDGDGNVRMFFNSSGNATIPGALTVSGGITGLSSAADDISLGDAAVTIATTTGNITIDAQANDSDIIFKGTDNNIDTTFLTISGANAGAANFNSTVTATGFIIGNANINENDLEAIDGVVAGAVSASKVVTVNSNKDVTGFGNITSAGTITGNNLTAGSTVTGTTLDISGNADVAGAFTLNGTPIGNIYSTIASPTFTGTPAAPTATAGTNTTQIATTAFVSTAVSNLVNSAPAALDTLDELAAALGDDANFSTTVTNNIATKLNSSAVSSFGLTLIDDADAATARTTLGLGSLATQSSVNVDSNIDTHLNTSTAGTNQYLQWNGSDYQWNTVTVSGFAPLTGATFTGNIILPQTGVLAFNSVADEYITATASNMYLGVDNGYHIHIDGTNDHINFRIDNANVNGNLHYDANDYFALESSDYLSLQSNVSGTLRSVILGNTFFKPFNADTGQLDLGISAAKWKDLHLSGSANMGGSLTIDQNHKFQDDPTSNSNSKNVHIVVGGLSNQDTQMGLRISHGQSPKSNVGDIQLYSQYSSYGFLNDGWGTNWDIQKTKGGDMVLNGTERVLVCANIANSTHNSFTASPPPPISPGQFYVPDGIDNNGHVTSLSIHTPSSGGISEGKSIALAQLTG